MFSGSRYNRMWYFAATAIGKTKENKQQQQHQQRPANNIDDKDEKKNIHNNDKVVVVNGDNDRDISLHDQALTYFKMSTK